MRWDTTGSTHCAPREPESLAATIIAARIRNCMALLLNPTAMGLTDWQRVNVCAPHVQARSLLASEGDSRLFSDRVQRGGARRHYHWACDRSGAIADQCQNRPRRVLVYVSWLIGAETELRRVFVYLRILTSFGVRQASSTMVSRLKNCS